VATSRETNLKYEVTLFGGTGSTVNDFVPSSFVIARGTNNAYDSDTVVLGSAVSSGLHLIRIQSVAQTANTAADGAAFPAYGSVVSLHVRGCARTLSSCLHAIAVVLRVGTGLLHSGSHGSVRRRWPQYSPRRSSMRSERVWLRFRGHQSKQMQATDTAVHALYSAHNQGWGHHDLNSE
jgi:hypothetical protein